MFDPVEESFEARAGVDDRGRLRRPVAVALVGSFVSLAVAVVILARPDGEGAMLVASIATVLLGTLSSIAYAVIGSRVGKAAADRLVAIVGFLIMAAGAAYIIYLTR